MHTCIHFFLPAFLETIAILERYHRGFAGTAHIRLIDSSSFRGRVQHSNQGNLIGEVFCYSKSFKPFLTLSPTTKRSLKRIESSLLVLILLRLFAYCNPFAIKTRSLQLHPSAKCTRRHGNFEISATAVLPQAVSRKNLTYPTSQSRRDNLFLLLTPNTNNSGRNNLCAFRESPRSAGRPHPRPGTAAPTPRHTPNRPRPQAALPHRGLHPTLAVVPLTLL